MPLKPSNRQLSRFLHKRKAHNQFFRVAADLSPLYQVVSRWMGPRRSFSSLIKLFQGWWLGGWLIGWCILQTELLILKYLSRLLAIWWLTGWRRGRNISAYMATGLSLSPLEGNRWNEHGDRSDNVICGMEFELSCAHRLWGDVCKIARGNKKC